MKWVAITLLLLNGVFLVVHLSRSEAEAPRVELFPFSGPRLELLAEKEKLDKAKAFAEKNRRQQLAAAAPVEEPVAEPTPVPAAPKLEEVKKPEVVAKAEPKTAPQPIAKPVAKPQPAPKPVSKSNAMACYSVGPFLLISDVNGVSQLFSRAQILTQERAESQRQQVGYWVYVPPMSSMQQARTALSKIKEGNVSDVLIISEGTKANAISAGVYKTEELGNERQKLLAELGYKARVEPLYRTQPQYWLDLELMNSTQIPERLWREITAGYPRIKQLRRKCE